LKGSKGWIRSESLDGEVPPHVDSGLLFETVRTPMLAEGDSGLVSVKGALFYTSRSDGRLWRSENGREWTERRSPAGAIESGWGDWYNAMLVPYRHPDGRELLVLRFRERESDEHGQNPPRYVTYDVARDQWKWTRTCATATHGMIAVGSQLWGIAAAVGGNYGGPIVRVDLGQEPAIDERTVLVGFRGVPGSRWWFSRAAKVVLHDGMVYGIKNDWVTPAPDGPDETGDRLFVVDPEAYRPSDFAGGFPWREEAWKAAETPARDLGALPFEPGHGSALVSLPPRWCASIGEKGGLLVVAGCSPSDHEGFGPPSDLFALYDIATGTFSVGRLPAPTGAGTSATLHEGKVFLKRGGLSYGPDNEQLWIVGPVSAEKAAEIAERNQKKKMRLDRVERVTWTFDSGGAPFDVWLDGLRFE
jgi:hypothetical protein